MTLHLTFACETTGTNALLRTEVRSVAPRQFVIAGWTGRDAAAIDHHIHELQLIGVPAPSQVPLYYRASASLLTQATTIEVIGPDSSGEAEPVLFFAAGEWWLTVGSDHTDRKVETYSIAVSKQMCPKPVAALAWRWAEISGYQDELELSSRIMENGRWVDYQRGTFSSIRPLEALRDGFYAGAAAQEGSFICCGTLGAIPNAEGAGIRSSSQMEIEIRDPRRQRSIMHRYRIQSLPVVA